MQNAVVGVVKEQKQLLGQGWMALQVPLQAKPLGSLRNWRAETVPALKTAMTIAPNKKFCVVFLMMDSPFHYKTGGAGPLLRQRLSSRGMRQTSPCSCIQGKGADTAGGALNRTGASAAARGKAFCPAPQLPGGNGSRKENGGDDRCQHS